MPADRSDDCNHDNDDGDDGDNGDNTKHLEQAFAEFGSWFIQKNSSRRPKVVTSGSYSTFDSMSVLNCNALHALICTNAIQAEIFPESSPARSQCDPPST